MTEPEGPDSLGSLFGGLADRASVPAEPSATPASASPAPVSPAALPSAAVSSAAALTAYPTRRSLREAESASPRTARDAAPGHVPGIAQAAAELVPAGPVLPSGEEPQAPRSPRAARRAALRAARAAERAARVEARAAASSPLVRHPVRSRISAAGTMVVIGGLFAALGLPAYAEGDQSAAIPETSAQEVQSFAVSEAASASEVERDSYGATSAATLRATYLDRLRQANLALYERSGARAQGDDYPWPAALHSGQGGGLSPLRYYYRECVDFVAWRLNRDAGVTGAPWKWEWGSLTPGGGSAISWRRQWEAHGWAVSSTPAPGWVAWFGGANHVAYVAAVNGDGTILLEEYNWGNNHAYNRRVVDPSSVTAFLAPPG